MLAEIFVPDNPDNHSINSEGCQLIKSSRELYELYCKLSDGSLVLNQELYPLSIAMQLQKKFPDDFYSKIVWASNCLDDLESGLYRRVDRVNWKYHELHSWLLQAKKCLESVVEPDGKIIYCELKTRVDKLNPLDDY